MTRVGRMRPNVVRRLGWAALAVALVTLSAADTLGWLAVPLVVAPAAAAGALLEHAADHPRRRAARTQRIRDLERDLDSEYPRPADWA